MLIITFVYKGKDSVELFKATGAGTLDCTRSKQFWISWDSIHLRVGEGYTDSAPFLHYQTRMGNLEQINVLGFTSTETSKAEWRIPQNQGKGLTKAEVIGLTFCYQDQG